MHPNTRALIAVAAARLIAGGPVGPVFDHSRLRNLPLSGWVGDGRVAIFDIERRCYFMGSNGSFHDHGRAAHILLRISGHTFSGYDHGDHQQFSGSMKDGSVLLYDFGESAYFTYTVGAAAPVSPSPSPGDDAPPAPESATEG